MRVPSTGDKLPLSTRRGTRRARVVAVGPRSSAVARVVVVAIVFYCEVWAFRRAASRCEWADTGQDAVRLLVGADPQLIDYATSYPQRNALLRWLTVVLTDVYAKKSWRWAVYESKPDAIVWLGDLLDAGRSFVATNERTYAKEAHRFHSVFPVPLDEHLDRRTVPLIVVPGNHDVSIYTGDGINAFERYFGQAHSVHSMAGWEIVAIDAVSLVAGSQQERDWIVGLPKHDKPRILLTHVPLYRPEGTDCGPKRESRRMIRQGTGSGYQNELSEQDSQWLLQNIPNVHLVLSGDDHDYCEVTHTVNERRVKETTLKAFSMAMGVRKPGYELVSLWTSGEFASVKQVTCTLPDQIGLWLYVYVSACVVALLALVLPRLYRIANRRATVAESNGLPIAHKHKRSLSRQLLSKVQDDEEVVLANGDTVSADADPHVVEPFAYYSSSADDGYGYHAPINSESMPSPARARRPSRLWMWSDSEDDYFGTDADAELLTDRRRRRGYRRRKRQCSIRAVLSRLEGIVLWEALTEFWTIAWPGVAYWIALTIYYYALT